MTQDELKNAVSTVLEQPHSTQLYLILKVNDELVLRLADIEDDNTAPEVSYWEQLKAVNVLKSCLEKISYD